MREGDDEDGRLKSQSRATLLVVDDEADITEIIQSWLECDEIRVLTATRAYEALHILQRESVDVLLSDIRMPEMDGISLFRHAESLSASKGLEVLLMTASYDPRRGEALGTGVRGVIQKPFTSRELLSWIYYSVSAPLKAPFENKLRHPVHLPARYGKSKVDLAYEGTVLNMSRNGLLLATDDWSPKTGNLAYLCLRIPGQEPLFLTGKVAWVKKDPSGSGKMHIGFDVTATPETALARFRNHVRDLQKVP